MKSNEIVIEISKMKERILGQNFGRGSPYFTSEEFK